MKRFFSHPQILSFAGNILASLAGFLSIWILARLFNPVELGNWMLYLTAFSLVDMLRSGSVQTAFIRLSTDHKSISVKGSAWAIASGLTLLLITAFYLTTFIFPDLLIPGNFIIYLPLLSVVSLPFNMAVWFRQAAGNFKHILYLRLCLAIPFLLFVTSGFLFPFALQRLIQVHVACYTLVSGVAIFSGWTDMGSIKHLNKQSVLSLINFGKHSMVTLLGTNLLKSSDVYMIHWFLGPSAVALYSLPYKLIELAEIPLRSFAATALPQLSRHHAQNNLPAVQKLFNRNTGFLTFAIIPLALCGLLFAEPLLILVAGKTYASSAPVFRLFMIYSLLLPLDRFLGITLDSIHKPHLNTLKVFIMAIINVAGNLFVLNLFASPVAVAASTVFTIICGVVTGSLLLKQTLPVQVTSILQEGYRAISHRLQTGLPQKV